MKLKFTKKNRMRNEAERKGWFNRLWDSTKRVATKVACVVAVPVVVFVPGCSDKTPGTVDYLDAGTPDALVQNDSTVQQDAEPQPDSAPPPCIELRNRGEVKNLIGDYLNRDLDDRVDNQAGDERTAYLFSTPETDENANPFADATGMSIGPMETFLYRVSGDDFTPLINYTVIDDDQGMQFSEKQYVWIKGDSEFNVSEDAVTGYTDFIAYSLKFDGYNLGFGIPVCSNAINGDGDYNYCKSGAPDADYLDQATECHNVRIRFLNQRWVITEMSPPDVEALSETKVHNGGSVKIGKEEIFGIVLGGESLPYDNLKFQVVNVEQHGGEWAAVIAVLDANDNELQRDIVFPCTNKEFNVGGKSYLVRMYAVSPGVVWADFAIYSDEIEIVDGNVLDPSTGKFGDWQATLGWKNRNVSATSTKPDHLRTIVVWSDQIDDLMGNGYFRKGDSVEIADNFTLCYGGLDVTADDRETVTFDLEMNTPEYFTDVISSRGYHYYLSCELNPPFMKVSTSATGNGFLITDNGIVSADDEMYVALNNLYCEEVTGEFGYGSLIIKESPNANTYVVYEYRGPELAAVINVVDQPEGTTMGGITWSKWEDCTAGSGSFISNYILNDPAETYTPEPEFVFATYENARSGSDVMLFAFDGQSINTDVLSTITSLFRQDHVTYSPAGPIDIAGMTFFEGENFITERGSVVRTVSNDTITFEIPTRVAYSVFYIGTEE